MASTSRARQSTSTPTGSPSKKRKRDAFATRSNPKNYSNEDWIEPPNLRRPSSKNTPAERLANAKAAKEKIARQKEVQRRSGRSDNERHHVPRDDEVDERENPLILGEVDDGLPDDDTRHEDEDEVSDLPMRELNNFEFFDAKTNELHSLDTLLSLDVDIALEGAGFVRPIYRSDDDEEEDNFSIENEEESEEPTRGQYLRISAVFFTHIAYSDPNDMGIWVQTQFAWYKLGIPSRKYANLYRPFFKRHRLSQLVINSCLTEDRKLSQITYDDFVEKLKICGDSPDEVAEAIPILGAELTEADVLGSLSYILSDINEIPDTEDVPRLHKVPLVRALQAQLRRGRSPSRVDSDNDDNDDDDDGDIPRRRERGQINDRLKKRLRHTRNNIEEFVLKNRNPTYVTPFVHSIAGQLFDRTLLLAADNEVEHPALPLRRSIVPNQEQVSSINKRRKNTRWIGDGKVTRLHTGNRTIYTAVQILGVTYKKGHFVMIDAGDDDNRERRNVFDSEASQSSNSLANTMWFGQIMELFENAKKAKMCHVRWFQHGAKTILQETAHPLELFATNQCDDQPLHFVSGKCQVRQRLPGEEEPQYNPAEENNFFYRFLWNEKEVSFTDTQSDPYNPNRSNGCHACAHVDNEAIRSEIHPVFGDAEGFRYGGHEYHIYDFVYIGADGLDVFGIGQILSIDFENKVVLAQLCGRGDALRDMTPFPDTRAIYLTSDKQEIKFEDLRGTCVALHPESIPDRALDNFKTTPNSFRIIGQTTSQRITSIERLEILSKDEVPKCEVCSRAWLHALDLEREWKERKRLKGLALYSSGGGIELGLLASGYVDTRYAVDFSPSACHTFSAHHSAAVVYNQCGNLLLEAKVNQRQNLKALYHNEDLPPLPNIGEIDLITCGPSCQGFSGLNRYKSHDDVRNTLMANAMSYVEFYKPKYFMLENVPNLLREQLRPRQVGDEPIEKGIKWGFHKFILRTLTGLGYQVSWAILHSGFYGTPQNRRRVIYWAARQGHIIPRFPLPSHTFAHQVQLFSKLPIGGKSSIVVRPCGGAPHRGINAEQAIDDLPGFDWINPHSRYRATPEEEAEARARRERGLPAFDCSLTSTRAGGSMICTGLRDHVPYTHRPRNAYQDWIRKGSKDVTLQITRCFDQLQVERIVSIPLKEDADHRNLPPGLEVKGYVSQHGAAGRRNLYPGLYGRVGDIFPTVVTVIDPSHKQGKVLHPEQKRVLTVRECARAQGFPDRVELLSCRNNIQDLHRIIGNAVPVPMSLALGQELGAAAIAQWKLEHRDLNSNRF